MSAFPPEDKSGIEEGSFGPDPAYTDQLTPTDQANLDAEAIAGDYIDGENEKACAAEDGGYGSTPNGRRFTRHYVMETGPIRNIPGTLIDDVVENYPGQPGRNGITIYYDPSNDATVVTGDGGSIVSARRGPP